MARSSTKLRPPRLRFLGEVADLSVYLVSGEWIRNEVDIDFTMGGNEAVYPSSVPLGEIFIDDAAHGLDRTATALHEIVERDQMLRFGKDYEVASAHERPFRRDLARGSSKEFDARRMTAAYRAYLRDPERHPVLPRPDDPPKTERQLDHEIVKALGRPGRLGGKTRCCK